MPNPGASSKLLVGMCLLDQDAGSGVRLSCFVFLFVRGGLRVEGLSFRVLGCGFGFRVSGVGFKSSGLVFRAYSLCLGFRGFRFWVSGAGCRVSG